MSTRAIIDVSCPHCHARADEPCRSVGGRPIVEPHIRRMNVAGRSSAIARDAYAREVVQLIFGHVDDELLECAKRDRAIDPSKPWVWKALRAKPKHIEQQLGLLTKMRSDA